MLNIPVSTMRKSIKIQQPSPILTKQSSSYYYDLKHCHHVSSTMIFFVRIIIAYWWIMTIRPSDCLIRNVRLQIIPPTIPIMSSPSDFTELNPVPDTSSSPWNPPVDNPSLFFPSSLMSSLSSPSPSLPSTTTTSTDNRKVDEGRNDSRSNNDSESQHNRMRGRRKPRNGWAQRYQPNGTETLDSDEERQRSQMEWLVWNTNNILGEDAPAPGEMPPFLIRITHDLLTRWSLRSSAVRNSQSAPVIERLLRRLIVEKNAGNDNVSISTEDYNEVLWGWAYSDDSESGERAMKILMEMEQDHSLKPTCNSYNAVIKAYVKNGNRETAANKAYDIVLQMEATEDPLALPNKQSYNLLLYALSNAPSSIKDAPERAEAVLKRMKARYRRQKHEMEAAPSSSTSSLSSPSPSLPSMTMTSRNNRKVEEGRNDIHSNDDNKSQHNRTRGRRNPRHGRHQRYQPNGTETLDLYEERQRSQMEWLVRNTNNILGEDAPAPGEMPPYLIRITHDLLTRWSLRSSAVKHTKHSRSAPVIERLLRRLIVEKNAGNDNVSISTEDYNEVLWGWANSDDSESGERTMKILMEMEQDHSLKPTCNSYNAVIKAYVKNGNRETAANKVYDIVLQMEATEDPLALPNKQSYNLLLYALSNAPSSIEDAPERAEAVLKRMIARYRHQKHKMEAAGEDYHDVKDLKPDVNSFNQAIGAWARGRRQGYEEGMVRMYNLLLELSDEFDVAPNADTFKSLMAGWLKSDDRDAITKIQDTFNSMEESYKNGNTSARPDDVSINMLHVAFNKYRRTIPTSKADCFERVLALEEEYKIPPNFISQNILMDSVIKSGRADAPELAYSILASMEEDFKAGQVDMKPDGSSYCKIINAYVTSQRDDRAEKAEEILHRMWDFHHNYGGPCPEVNIYNLVLNAYASIESPHALERAMELLRDMEHGETEGLPKPDLITYNTLIKALKNGSKEEGAVFAENLLLMLESKGQREPTYLPDGYSYIGVIKAYGSSNSRQKAEKALEILTRMMSCYENGNEKVIPTIHSFNAAIKACAYVEGNEREKASAFETAMAINELRLKSPYEVRPDITWYGTLLRACSSLLPPSERREIEVDRFFGEACKMGCVGRLVITQLKFAATPEQYRRLTEKEVDYRIDWKELPKEWTMNVRDPRPVHKTYATRSSSMQTSSKELE